MSDLITHIKRREDLGLIKDIQFGILSPQMIKRGSVCEILSYNTFSGNMPIINGLFDPRMGTIDYNRRCETCENEADTCPGHFGHIELGLPVYNMNFMDYIIKILRSVCNRCGKLLINKEDPKIIKLINKYSGLQLFDQIYEHTNKKNDKLGKVCKYNCGCFWIQPKYVKKINKTGDNLIIQSEFSGIEAVEQLGGSVNQESLMNGGAELSATSTSSRYVELLDPLKCRKILQKITDDDCRYIGLNPEYARPEWMIYTAFPIPPPSMRPSVKQPNGQRSEDDLTTLLANIVKYNNLLKKNLSDPEVKNDKIRNHYALLQYNILTFNDNEKNGIKKNSQRVSGRPLKAVIQRLGAKNGRIRGNIMGKRVDFSGRTVISVDPNISIDEYGVPQKMAMNLTFPETVTKYNIKKMYRLLRNGPNKYPGANILVKNTKCNNTIRPCSISLKHVDLSKVVLNPGDVLHRHLLDGDYGLFNRQPSLHRMNMMAHRVRVIPHNTFRLNVFVCKPYNADYDGDEMNTHIPQSYQTMTELKHLTSVPTQIISPASSKPLITIEQDTLIGAYRMTHSDIRITKKNMFNYLMFDRNFTNTGVTKLPQAIDEKISEWSGRQLYSQIIPEVSLQEKNTWDSNSGNKKEVNKVVIQNGNLVSGVLSKSILGSKLAHFIHNQYNPKVLINFMDKSQMMVIRWMTNDGFTVGLGDCLITDDIKEEVSEYINKKLAEANKIIVEAEQGVFKTELNEKYRAEAFELALKKAITDAGQDSLEVILKYQTKKNNIIQCIDSGVKGKKTNLTQISGSVGQQDIMGARIPFKYTDRTLPHFHKLDNGAASRGFCKSSFSDGLKPHEFFFHAISGRIGVIDTAVKTKKSGYIQRRMIKAGEDIRVKYDGTVRDSFNNIVQHKYGDDSFDPIKLERQKLELIKLSNQQIIDDFEYLDNKKEVKQIFKDRDDLRNNYFKYATDLDLSVLSPINFKRLIERVIIQFGLDTVSGVALLNDNGIGTNSNKLTQEYVIDEIIKLCNKDIFKKHDILKIMIRYYLGSKKCIEKYNLNKASFDFIIEMVYKNTKESLVQPGELVGIICAQSIGEVLTQMTLNTFHLAGVGSKAVITTSGVPRLREIIDLNKNIKTPSMSIYLDESYSTDKNKANMVKSKIEITKFRNIISKVTTLYDSNNDYTSISTDEELEFIRTYNEFNNIIGVDYFEKDILSKWVLVLEFDKSALITKNITISDIEESIRYNLGAEGDIQTIISDNNSSNISIRIKIRDDKASELSNDEDEGTSGRIFMRELKNSILNITLKGVNKLKKVGMTEENKIVYYDDGSSDMISEWVLNTDGTNLKDIINNRYIDATRTISNDIWEVYNLFGIEAARNLIIEQLLDTINSDGSNKINYRHVELLVDIMCRTGGLMPITRNGINKRTDEDPIAKMSFEKVHDIIVKSSIFSYKDEMKGVSANVMMGQLPPIGTNIFNASLDEKAFERELKELGDNIPEYVEDDVKGLTTKEEQEKYDTITKQINDLYDDFDVEQFINDNSFRFVGIPKLDTQSRIARIVHVPLSVDNITFNSNTTGTNIGTKNKKPTRKKIKVVKNSGKK